MFSYLENYVAWNSQWDTTYDVSHHSPAWSPNGELCRIWPPVNILELCKSSYGRWGDWLTCLKPPQDYNCIDIWASGRHIPRGEKAEQIYCMLHWLAAAAATHSQSMPRRALTAVAREVNMLQILFLIIIFIFRHIIQQTTSWMTSRGTLCTVWIIIIHILSWLIMALMDTQQQRPSYEPS